MQKIKLKVFNEQGVHARPSTKICSLTNKFSGKVNFIFNEEVYDAKNIMEIMLIGLEQGNEFEVVVDGESETEELALLDALKTLVEIEEFK